MSLLHSERYGEGWEAATCAQIGGTVADEIFFSSAPDQVAQAVALCWECPVRAICLRAALEEEQFTPVAERFGIRGGLTPSQRATLQPHRLCPDCGTPVVTRSPHCEPDRIEHRLAHRRDYERQERTAA